MYLAKMPFVLKNILTYRNTAKSNYIATGGGVGRYIKRHTFVEKQIFSRQNCGKVKLAGDKLQRLV
jgi:hypothetical protein